MWHLVAPFPMDPLPLSKTSVPRGRTKRTPDQALQPSVPSPTSSWSSAPSSFATDAQPFQSWIPPVTISPDASLKGTVINLSYYLLKYSPLCFLTRISFSSFFTQHLSYLIYSCSIGLEHKRKRVFATTTYCNRAPTRPESSRHEQYQCVQRGNFYLSLYPFISLL